MKTLIINSRSDSAKGRDQDLPHSINIALLESVRLVPTDHYDGSGPAARAVFSMASAAQIQSDRVLTPAVAKVMLKRLGSYVALKNHLHGVADFDDFIDKLEEEAAEAKAKEDKAETEGEPSLG